MKRPLFFLLFAAALPLGAQDPKRPSTQPSAWPQRSSRDRVYDEPAEPLPLPAQTVIQDNSYYPQEEPTVSQNEPDLNQLDLSKFLITPGPGMLPPMPPSLTNTPQDLLNSILSNRAAMTNSNYNNRSTNMEASRAPRLAPPYAGMEERIPPRAAVGVWWRFYAQNTSVFNIPAAVEEMIIIADNGDAVWSQNIQTAGTVQSKSQRRLSISVYENFGGEDSPLWIFYYPSKEAPNTRSTKPSPRTVTNTETVFSQPSYFVRLFPEQGFMQMSKNPKFPQDQTMYWRYYPRDIPEILAPAQKPEADTRATLKEPAAYPEAYDVEGEAYNPELPPPAPKPIAPRAGGIR